MWELLLACRELPHRCDEACGGASVRAITAVGETEFTPKVDILDWDQHDLSGDHFVLREAAAKERDVGDLGVALFQRVCKMDPEGGLQGKGSTIRS
jgi:hypothetical protein